MQTNPRQIGGVNEVVPIQGGFHIFGDELEFNSSFVLSFSSFLLYQIMLNQPFLWWKILVQLCPISSVKSYFFSGSILNFPFVWVRSYWIHLEIHLDPTLCLSQAACGLHGIQKELGKDLQAAWSIASFPARHGESPIAGWVYHGKSSIVNGWGTEVALWLRKPPYVLWISMTYVWLK